MDFNDFSLEEQILINHIVLKIKNKQESERSKEWAKFFKAGFEAVCKTISKAF